MHVFVELDRQLVGILREDGRAPLSKFADILHVSRGTVQAIRHEGRGIKVVRYFV